MTELILHGNICILARKRNDFLLSEWLHLASWRLKSLGLRRFVHLPVQATNKVCIAGYLILKSTCDRRVTPTNTHHYSAIHPSLFCHTYSNCYMVASWRDSVYIIKYVPTLKVRFCTTYSWSIFMCLVYIDMLVIIIRQKSVILS